MSLRYESRKQRTLKKRKRIFTRVITVGLFLAIISVGIQLLTPDQKVEEASGSQENTTPSNKVEEPSNKEESESNHNDQGGQLEGSTTPPSEEPVEEPAEETSGNNETGSENKEEQELQDPSNPYINIGEGYGGPDGPWQPIGTVQEEPHVATYEGIDFEEMKMALRYATGLSKEDIIYWEVRNNGGANKVYGIVSNYENKTTPYYVELEWVESKGWKPTLVNREENYEPPNN